jgi:hypothetical protein
MDRKHYFHNSVAMGHSAKQSPTRLHASAALIGIGLAFLCARATRAFHCQLLDGMASTLGLVLAGIAAILARRPNRCSSVNPRLPEVENSIPSLASNDPNICKVNGLVTVHLVAIRILLY